MPLDRRRRALAAALVLLVTLVAMEALAIITILPHVKDDLGGIAWYAWVISAFQLAQIAGIPVTGRLLDRTNPNRMFIAISAAGAFRTDDAGKTWTPINRGLRSQYVPDPDAERLQGQGVCRRL